jgi:signal transduction histidine kinase/AraC-like DNA-binding protein
VHGDSRGLMWIGSNNGLSVYDMANDRLHRADETAGLTGNAVMSIIEDDRNALWMGTKNGLLKLIPHHKGSELDLLCTAYYENEGVQGRIFNRNSVCHTSGKQLILGGTTGLTVFNPADIQYNNYPPEVVVTGLMIRNNRILPNTAYDGNVILEQDICYVSDLELDYDERSFTLTVSALNYFLPAKTVFTYKMDGFDKSWTTVDALNRNITYTNLPPGDYTFTVKARNNDGVESGPMLLHINIKAPLLLTAWAFMAYVAAGLAVIYLFLRIAVHIQRRKESKRQESLTAKRLHETDEMKLKFFTNISHEFRTPLTLIMAPLEKLIKRESDSESRDMLSLIHDNANRLLSLVNQLLDFRKIDARGTQLLLSSGDIIPFVRNIVYSFKDLSEEKNIRFSFSTSFPYLMMSFDTDMVFKILSNLIANAFNFTPNGGEITVTLRLERQDASTDPVIEVSDNGVGIEASRHEMIFQRFYRVPSANGDTHAGTGIGLHLCREYARIHKGHITVESEPGIGSAFSLHLPYEEENLREVISSPGAAPTDDARRPSPVLKEGLPSILVADDHKNFRLFMQQSLSATYNVFTASDGEEAWEITVDKLPDMVITDWMMPVMDGIELCRKIKNDIRTSHIWVILLTAKPAITGKRDSLEAGVDDYIEKPFSLDMLQLKIQHLIEYKDRIHKQFVHSMTSGIQLTGININSLDEQIIRKSIAFVEEHIADPSLSVEWLSREMAMSRTNYYRKIHFITGKTPVEFIRAIRMKHAALMLEKEHMRVSDVALSVGFSDNRLFRKHFKEEFGILPSKLRGHRPSLLKYSP